MLWYQNASGAKAYSQPMPCAFVCSHAGRRDAAAGVGTLEAGHGCAATWRRRRFPRLRGALGCLALLLLCGLTQSARAAQIAPNPNPSGSTLTVSGADRNDGGFTNNGTIEIGGTGSLYNTDVLTNIGIIHALGVVNNTWTIDNYGGLIIDSGGVLTSSTQWGSIKNESGATFENNGLFTNNTKSVFNNYGTATNSGTMGNYGTVNNDGVFISSYILYNYTGGEFYNNGIMYNTGRIENYDWIANSGTWNNSGVLTSSGWLANSSWKTWTNTGTITTTNIVYNYLHGTWINDTGGTLANSGAFYNWGELTNNGTFTNTGTLNNSNISGTLHNTGTLINSGTIANNGAITNTGSLHNSGTLSGAGSYTQSGSSAITTNTGTFQAATISISGGVFYQNAGALSADSLTIDSGATLNYAGGALSTTSGILTDNGLLLASPASGTTLTIPASLSIIGTGALTKTGDGTLVLAGTNTYTGATTITGGTLSISSANNLQGTSGIAMDGGTLQATATLELGKAITLGSGGGTFDVDTGKSLTLSGGISDAVSATAGSLAKTGAGTLLLKGTNTYSGNTSVNAGTLQAGATNAFSPNSVVVLANVAGATLDLNDFDQTVAGLSGGGTSGGDVSLGSAALTVNQNVDTTYAGVISGTGSLRKSGLGTLTLTGTNTYSGGTTLIGGTLAISSDANLGAVTGVLTFDGGTLRTNADCGIYRAINVSGNGTLDNAGNNVSLSGVLTGAGTLTLAGSGTDTLGATFDGSGFAGTLDVASAATLAGVGTVHNLSVSGTISPGNSPGTITVTGDYTQSATGNYICQVTPTASDLINVTGGSATLAGTLTVVPEYAFYNSGTTWIILTTTGGVTGTLTSGISGSTPANWILAPVSMGNAVAVTLMRAAYAASATSVRSSATGAGLNAAAYSATGELATLIQYLDYSYGTDSNLAAWSVAHNALTDYVLNVLSPEPYDAFTQVLFDGGRLLTSVQRAGLYSGEAGGGAIASPGDIGPASIAGASGPSGAMSGLDDKPWRVGGNGLGVFIKPLGMLSGQKGSADRTGYNTVTGGVTGGMLFSPGPAWTFALAPGYVTQSMTLHSEGGGKGTVEDWSLALLGGYRQDGWHADIGVRAGYDAYRSTRNLPLPTSSGAAKATWNGWNTSITAGGGYDCKLGALDLGPFASVQWQHAHEDGFRESRVGTLGQSLRERSADALTTIVGGRVSRTFETAGGLVVTPEIRAGWSAEWLSNPGYITASFLGSSASAYHAVTADQRYHSMLLDAGVTMRLQDRLSLSAKVGVKLFRPGHEAQAASIGFTYSF